MRFLFLLLLISTVTFSQKEKDSVLYSKQKKRIIDIGVNAFYSKDTFILKKSTKQLLNFYNRRKDSTTLAKYYHFKALYQKIVYTNDSAFYYYHQSKNVSKLLKDSIAVGGRLLSIANLQREAKDFLGSEISSVEALEYLEPTKAYEFLEYVYNNLGIVSDELNQKNEAIKYYNRALEINKINKNEKGYLFIVNNLGFLYQKRTQHKKAIKYFKKGLTFDSIKIKYPAQYALLLENLAYSNFSLEKNKSVLKQYQEVLEIRDSLKDYSELSTTHINICLYYKEKKNVKQARFHAEKALTYAKQTHNNKRWLDALEELSQLSTGKKAIKYLEEHIDLNDSLIQKERTQKNQFAKIRYETTKKEEENSFLKIENDKKQDEIVRHKQQKVIGWLVAVAGFLSLGLSILFFVLRRRKLLYQAQLQKAQAREQERKQIAKSLHDEVAGDLRLLHRKLEKSQLFEEAQKLDAVKENVRQLSHQLSSVSFKKVGFKDQIINLISDYFELTFKITVKGLHEQDWSQVNSAIKRLLYLSIRESIQNSKKHAKATKFTIAFSIHKKNVFLDVTDNGIGFDTSVSKKGIGLHNLQERVEELNGTLSITSTVGAGTETHIQIPLNV
ncbi:Histidine kinase-, DNA gyrase B-, and HSP90-like ATPase [Tenacibaculum sp. MAR_2010_89]|uniref:tetratricopeptide repeat-containing sensor histidine kinase n=1 Tax=Tenacibaculum sp. MAR_2010_89 TaxID=1250198 RepID=UPI0008989D56|nr:tetratricopeptide repeat-containing sensor histidine kinase [Tenacibaculum sp. MAR_2010_89]SED98266.1 Histidine kinase-, DNA gyrase B-, and HSP90-like ATPase [Tenacibaculum sp. MAR_2010_89]